MMKSFAHCAILFLALVICTMPVSAQTAFTVTINASDGASAGQLIIGVHPSATNCIDPGLGETELPPVPLAGIFDIRSIDFTGHSCAGKGLAKDIRPFFSTIQNDSFLVSFQMSSEATRPTVLLTWPADLAALGGRWILRDAVDGSITIDMTSTDSAALDPDYNRFYIIRTDTARYRTFTMEKLVTDVDNFGKVGKVVKAAAYRVEFDLNLAPTQAVDGFHIDWTVALVEGTLEVTPAPSGISHDTKNMKYDIHWSPALSPGTPVTISAIGGKGKLQAGKYWWLNGTIVNGLKIKTLPTNFSSNILRAPMPNAFNAGLELMTALYPKGTLMRIGTTKPDGLGYVHSVVHQTYSDVLKSLWSKKNGYQTKGPSCFDYFDKDGVRNIKTPFKKEVKTATPDKHNNVLFGEALVLKVNIDHSRALNTPAGLGELVLQDGSRFSGMSIAAISQAVDTVLSCGTLTNPAIAGVTLGECLTLVHQLNLAFYSPEVDTFSFANGSKTGDVRFKGGVYLSDVPWLMRIPGSIPTVFAGQNAVMETQPEKFSLEQNYPNPFNPTTTIRFSLPQDAIVNIAVFDMLGREVGILADHEDFSEGVHEVDFDASNLSSGVYFYRLMMLDKESGAMMNQQLRKMILLK